MCVCECMQRKKHITQEREEIVRVSEVFFGVVGESVCQLCLVCERNKIQNWISNTLYTLMFNQWPVSDKQVFIIVNMSAAPTSRHADWANSRWNDTTHWELRRLQQEESVNVLDRMELPCVIVPCLPIIQRSPLQQVCSMLLLYHASSDISPFIYLDFALQISQAIAPVTQEMASVTQEMASVTQEMASVTQEMASVTQALGMLFFLIPSSSSDILMSHLIHYLRELATIATPAGIECFLFSQSCRRFNSVQ